MQFGAPPPAQRGRAATVNEAGDGRRMKEDLSEKLAPYYLRTPVESRTMSGIRNADVAQFQPFGARLCTSSSKAGRAASTVFFGPVILKK